MASREERLGKICTPVTRNSHRMKCGVFIKTQLLGHTRALASGFATLTFVAACTTPVTQAPVVDRLPSRSSNTAAASADGNYTVKAGDTLYSIALDFGLDWRELA